MKTVLTLLALLSPMLAHAAPAPAAKVFDCNVITNGNGKDWETAFHFEAPMNGETTNLKKTVINSYGATFSVDAGAIVFPVPGLDLNSYSIVLHVYLNNDEVELFGQALEMGEALQTTGNIADTSTTFALKVGNKSVSYGASCSIKLAKTVK
jgi:hypothetical protein